VTLPITALSDRRNERHRHDTTVVGPLVVLLTIMFIMSGMLLIWTHRRGWW
jgi:hypothetical protein